MAVVMSVGHGGWKWRSAAMLAVIAVLGLSGRALPSTGVRAGKQAAVKADVVYVHAKMDTTSYVVTILRRGERVMVTRVRRARKGPWCSVSELSQMVKLGYVRCQELERLESHSPRTAGKPASVPLAKARDSGITTATRYAVLVASLVDQGNALSVKRKLEDLGYTPVIHMTTAPIARYRVYEGEFRSREQAERTARRLNVDGFASNLVETAGKRYRLEIGWYFSFEKANDLANALKAKNYDPKIVSKTAPTPMHQVRVGGFADRAEALKVVEALQKEGLSARIVTDSF